MLCTNCNSAIKPVVSVDIDGTMGRYHEHFLRFAESYLGVQTVWDFNSSVSFRSWFKIKYGVTDDVWHDVKLAYRQGGMKRSMLCYPGAASLCQKAIHLGAELWVTTTRPYIRHDNIDPDTRHWLDRNGIRYDYLLYDGNKYEKLAQLVGSERVVFVLDDLVEELEDAEHFFRSDALWMRANVFNGFTQDFSNVSHNLLDASVVMEDRITTWRREHDHSAR